MGASPKPSSGRFRGLPAFYPIIDTGLCAARGIDPGDLALTVLGAGARLVQLRAKDLDDRTTLALADRIAREAERVGALFIVNDRADLALMSDAGGVHLGQDDLPPAAVRRFADALVIGLSTHTGEQIAAAAGEPVEYVAVGPIFGTATKETGYAPVGLDLVRRAVAHGGHPVVAIGGVTLSNAPVALAAGATAVAVISDLLVGSPGARAREYLAVLGP